MEGTPKQQLIYEFLKKMAWRKNMAIRLSKLSQEELKLLPELKEKDYVNFDSGIDLVWLTVDGYVYLKELAKSMGDKEELAELTGGLES